MLLALLRKSAGFAVASAILGLVYIDLLPAKLRVETGGSVESAPVAVSATRMFSHSEDVRSDSFNRSNSNISVAFLGNSMFYFNDCPKLVELLLHQLYDVVHQDSCLRGGANLRTLWQHGNGMEHKFAGNDIGQATVRDLLQKQSDWSFVVMNDHTQHPARAGTVQESIHVLRKHYIPLLQQQSPGNDATVLLLHTLAYKVPKMRGTEDLGDIDSFTDKIADGLDQYQRVLESSGIRTVIVPMGEAVRQLYHEDRLLWQKLYSWDDFHCSPHGTWLQACILVAIMTQREPPIYNESVWNKARYMQPPYQEPLPRPSLDEAEALRRLACRVTHVSSAEVSSTPRAEL